jgi:mono/diheme cytochrome c family protein
MKRALCIAGYAAIAVIFIREAPAHGNQVDAEIYQAWLAIRQLDCARCHGASFEGSVGPSLLESVRTRDQVEFIRLIVEGNAQRGMPPYKSIKRATDNIEGMYRYFKGRAEGTIWPGRLTTK